ncbi:MAG: hypothetical protein WDO19_21580 [Bacteroidota bacterium]
MKKILFSVLFFFSVSASFSQSFMHGAGVGIYVSKTPIIDATAAFTLSYSPRFNFLETDALSVSAGIPVNVGISGSYSASYSSYYGTTEENTLRVMLNAPLMVNLNVGAGSSKENESRFGFFVGGGFGFHYGDVGKIVKDDYGYEYYESGYGVSYGPAGNAGVRIAVGSNQKNIEIRLSYMKGIDDNKISVYGVNTLFNF